MTRAEADKLIRAYTRARDAARAAAIRCLNSDTPDPDDSARAAIAASQAAREALIKALERA